MIAANSVSSGVSCVPPPCGRTLEGGISGFAISHNPSGTTQLHVPRPMTRPTTPHHIGHALSSRKANTASSARELRLVPAGGAPLDHRTHDVMACQLPLSPPSLRAQGRAHPRLHEHRLHSYLLPAARPLM